MAVTLDDLVTQIAAMSTKVDAFIASNSQSASQFNQITQEKNLIAQLMIQDHLTQGQAISYLKRVQKGERPWLDQEARDGSSNI